MTAGRTHSHLRALLSAALAIGGVIAVSSPGTPTARAAVPVAKVVYDSIDDPLPSNAYSLPFQAQQTAEFGDVVQLAPGSRRLDSITVAFSSWACETGSGLTCSTTPGATFTHPITVNVYDYTSGAIGDLIATVTPSVEIPYRPSADPGCAGGRWKDSTGTCFSGKLSTTTFEFPTTPIVSNQLVWTVAFNTQTYGLAPTGVNGPYNSLNVGLSEADDATIGTDLDDDGVARNTKTAALYCDDGVGGTGTLRIDTCAGPDGWAGSRPMARISTIAASETASTVVVNGASTSWAFGNDGHADGAHLGQFVAGPAIPPAGLGSAELAVANTAEGEVFGTSMLGGTRLADLTELSFASNQPAGDVSPALQLSVRYDGAAGPWQGRLNYEPTYTVGTLASGWQRWNTLEGNWWASNPAGAPCDINTGGRLCSWSEILSLFPDAVVNPTAAQVLFKIGSGLSTPVSTNVDLLTIGVDDGAGNIKTTSYDFEPRPPSDPACVSTGITKITDVSQFSSTDIRPKGHFELVAGAAHIFTDDNSSQAKVAGFVTSPSPKLGASFTVNWAGTGIAPGAQVVLSDGSILVGETVYGNNYWATSSSPAAGYAPQTGGGFGSNYHGTPTEWQTAMDARGVTVADVGFSLGSGVLADGKLASVTAGCRTIEFDLPVVPPIVPVAPTPVETRDYNPVAPTRLFDTRPDTPASLRTVTKQKIGPTTSLEVKVTDLPGGLVPSSGVGAVTLNVTATGAGQNGYVTVTPCAVDGDVSSLNFRTNQDRANLAIVPVSARGTVCFASSVPVDVVVDVNGWFTADAGFVPVTPARVFDTRTGTPAALRTVVKQPVGPSNPLMVKLTDLPGGVVPAAGVSAVSLNVTATGSASAGYLTVTPCAVVGEVSNVNFQSNTDIANAVLTPVSSNGEVCFTSNVDVNVVVDVNGWLENPSDFASITPTRVFDTRSGTPAALRTVAKQQVGPSNPLKVGLADLPGGLVPANGVGAVSLTVTATGGAQSGYVTVTPCGPAGDSSTVNFQAGSDTADAVLTPMSSGGEVCFSADVPVDLVVDVNGWFAD